jgi:GT2 family glycosyltransferase
MSTETARSLSIIIPNYNGETLLPMFIPNLFHALKYHPGPYEVIIVDDCSKDNSAQAMHQIAETYPNVKLLFNATNKGFSGTCNEGIRAAQYEIMFFFNNDVEIEEDYFNYYASHFDQPGLFAVTTCGYYYSNRKKPLDGIKTGVWKHGLPRVTGNIFNEQIVNSKMQAPYLSFGVQGAYFFADSKKVKQLHGFDEIYSPYIFEETDLGYRALKRGWKIHYEPRCIGYHQVSATINKAGTDFSKQVISNRNRIIFVWKNIDHLPYLISHCFFMLLKVITVNKVYIQALKQAYMLNPQIRQKRQQEQTETIMADKDIFNSFKAYFKKLQ